MLLLVGAVSLSFSPGAWCARVAVRRCRCCCCLTKLDVLVPCALPPTPLLLVSDGFTYCNTANTVTARRQMQTPKAKVRHQDQHLRSPPLLLWPAAPTAAAATACWGLPRGMPRETTACCCACDGLLAEGARRRSGPMLAVATDSMLHGQPAHSAALPRISSGASGACLLVCLIIDTLVGMAAQSVS